MSLRGSVTIECDQPNCHAELVLGLKDIDIDEGRLGVYFNAYADGWRCDAHDHFWCPDCAKGKAA